ncbi:MAG: phytoene/squalene synthase family protein [Gemmataceae bacterium]|nr:phytoene/squalene synthase family protein [Gemmata sp.]MDW8197598.1 phytoene/squalene synthase family protein [Gemmataceae bacterium]
MTESCAAPVWFSDFSGASAAQASFQVRQSFRYCRAVTAAAGSSFPLAFRLLPAAKRSAMEALYAYMRISDDLADQPGELEQRRQKLAAWRASLTAAIAGHFTHPIHAALIDTVHRFTIPPQYLYDTLDGMETDLGPVRMANFPELYRYCYRVASAVGLACVRIWGTRRGVTAADVEPPAEAAGIAFQLTNILRDLGDDLSRDRVYLPADELDHFACGPERWRDPSCANRFRALMQFQVARARAYYRRSQALLPLLTTDGRAIFHVMAGAYRRLLDEIERRHYDVFTHRVRLPAWRKAAVYLAGCCIKSGLW